MPRYHNDRVNIFPDDEDLIPRRQSLFGVLRREGNWKSFVLTVLIMGCMSSVIWCNTIQIDKEVSDVDTFPLKRMIRESPCVVGFSYIPSAFVLLLFIVYLVESYHSIARIQLSKKVDLSWAARRIYSLTTATPRVWWKAICYHYVRRKRRVTRYRDGDSYITNQVYYERVNTHSATTSFSQECCGQRDASRNLVLDGRTPITKIRFSKGFAFANIDAASEFEEQRSRFFTEQERYDDFMEMREGLELLGISSFKECMVAYRDVEQWRWYSSEIFYWALSCMLLSWPLRILLECNTSYVHYTITKIFGTNYEIESNGLTDLDTTTSESPPSVPASNYAWAELVDEQSAVICPTPRPHRNLTLSHASTVDSLELFAAIRENCAMVPSYSEAVRIDTALQEDPEENAIEVRALVATEPAEHNAGTTDATNLRRNTVLAGSHSSYNTASSSNAENDPPQQNRRSWTGVFNNLDNNILDEIRTQQPIIYQSVNAQPHSSSARPRVFFFAKQLPQTCSRDPFGGRQQTTPEDEPPTYEEALRLPPVRNLTRSNSGTELAGPRNAFLRDVITNRRSCLEGVGPLSGDQIVRIPLQDPGEETAL